MLGWQAERKKQPSMGSALQNPARWAGMLVVVARMPKRWIAPVAPGMAPRYQNQPDLRRNNSPDTASMTIGGSA